MNNLSSLVKQLEKEMAEAYAWGDQNDWPLLESYPQFETIQKIGKKLYEIGGEEAMREATEIVSQENSEYSGMLNHLFCGIGDWMA